MRNLSLASCLAFALLPALALAQVVAEAPSHDDWLRHRQSLTQDPSLLRLITFEGLTDPAPRVMDRAGKGGEVTYGVAAQPAGPEEAPRLVEGRWPEETAVRLDRGIFDCTAFDVVSKSFTVEAWLRTNGQGALRGDAIPTGGTLLSVGIGYWDGWRLTMLYPDGVIGLELGKQPGSFGIRTGPVADGVWHHIAATWDGRQARIYVDGLLAGSGEYSGDYTRPAPTAPLRIGYAGYGWGSTVTDVAEVAAYSRALPAAEVLGHACFHAPLSDALTARLDAADAAGPGDGGVAELEAALGLDGVHPHLRAAVEVQLGALLLAQGQTGPALERFAQAVDTRGLPEGLRSAAVTRLRTLAEQSADAPARVYEFLLARPEALSPRQLLRLRLNLAARYRRDGNPEAAAALYEEALHMEDVTPRDRLDALLQLGHSSAQAGDLQAARTHYEAIAEATDAPAQMRSHARLCLGRAYVAARQYDQAREQFSMVSAMTDAPPHHLWEAAECAREAERLAAGLPARDPAASRTQLPSRPAPGAQLWVSPAGSDANTGAADSPLATLRGARDAIRALRRGGGLPLGGVTVHVAAGEYALSETLPLEEQDSGTPDAPIVYQADVQGTARLTGGARVTGFGPVTDPTVLARLPEEVRGKVLQTDLRAQGITDFGVLAPRGMAHPPTPMMELFCNGEPMRLARWPNEGFLRTKAILGVGSAEAGTGISFEYEGDRPARWQQPADAWVLGYWQYLWADDSLPVAAVDAEQHVIQTARPSGYGGAQAGCPYYAYNILEELDQPGEWYLDRTSGILYLFPTSDPNEADIRVTMHSGPMVELTGVSDVTLQGLVLEYGRMDGVVVRGGTRCLLVGCTARNLGGTGVVVDGGTGHGVLSCDIYDLGRGGTVITGGDRKTLTPGGHFVENCHIHHFSRLDRTYTPSVLMNGVGNRFAHNLVHDTPAHGMRIEGNDHIIEFNEVYRAVQETDDQGGMDMFYNPSYRGVVVRYNYWHDLGGGPVQPCGTAGIRLDDAICGILLYGNVFSRCSGANFGAVQIHGGKDNWVENNIIADCRYGISFSGWGPDRWAQYVAGDQVARQTKQEVDTSRPPYSTRYPELARLADSPDVNRIWRNVVVGCGEFLTRDRGIQDMMDNLVTTADPGFADVAAGDYALKPDSALARGGGFRPIPFGEIGLYRDVWRMVLPTR